MHRSSKTIVLFLVLVLAFSAFSAVYAQETISVGDTVEGQITETGSGGRVEFNFEANEGDLLLISLVSTDFDSYLYLLDSNRRELMSNDDGGGSLNSLISGFLVPSTGTYIIQAATFGDNGTGSFRLTLDTFEANVIEYGQVVQGSSEEIPVSHYLFTGSEGDVIVIDLAGEGFDTYMDMTGPAGYTVSTSSYIDGQNARLGPVALSESGTYTLNVRAIGNFTLQLDNVEPIEGVLGDIMTGEFGNGVNRLYFTFDSPSAQVVDFIVDSGNTLDTKMDLVSPYGYVVASNDDAPRTVDPALESVFLNDSGIYYIIVSPQNPNATLNGEVSLKITEAALPSLDEGPVDISFNYDAYEQIFTFEGTAGEAVRLNIVLENASEYVSPGIDLIQDGQTFAYVNLRGMNQINVEFVVPADGRVNVVARAYDRVDMSITLGRTLE